VAERVASIPEPEWREFGKILTDLRVTVGEIKVTQSHQTLTLERLERRLDVSVLRDQYEGYVTAQKEVDDELRSAISNLRDAHQQKLGSDNAWRLIFSGALALLTVIVTAAGAILASGHPL